MTLLNDLFIYIKSGLSRRLLFFYLLPIFSVLVLAGLFLYYQLVNSVVDESLKRSSLQLESIAKQIDFENLQNSKSPSFIGISEGWNIWGDRQKKALVFLRNDQVEKVWMSDKDSFQLRPLFKGRKLSDFPSGNYKESLEQATYYISFKTDEKGESTLAMITEDLIIGSSIKRIKRTFLFIVFGIIIILLIFLMAERMTVVTRLKSLKQTLEAYGNFKFFQDPTDGTRDEIAWIGYRFDQMISQIEEHHMLMIESEKLASIGEMAGGIGHLVNTPLTIAQAEIERILSKSEEEKVLASSKKISSSLSRIDSILRSMREFARPDDKKSDFLNLHHEVERYTKYLRELYLADSIFIEIELAADSKFVRLQTSEFRQIFLTLFHNSREALRSREDKKISIMTFNPRSDIMKFVFLDNGIGMDAERLEKLFEGNTTGRDRRGGIGQRLGMVKSLVDRSGGQLIVTSKAEKWFQVEIEFPCVIDLESEDKSHLLEDHSRYGFSGLALVLDDEADVVEILGMYLEDFGLEVVTCTNTDQAKQLVLENSFDYIFTDLVMPKMRGDEFIQFARSHCKESCLFFLVSGGDPDRYKSLGTDDSWKSMTRFIPKPFSSEDIYLTLIERCPLKYKKSG